MRGQPHAESGCEDPAGDTQALMGLASDVVPVSRALKGPTRMPCSQMPWTRSPCQSVSAQTPAHAQLPMQELLSLLAAWTYSSSSLESACRCHVCRAGSLLPLTAPRAGIASRHCQGACKLVRKISAPLISSIPTLSGMAGQKHDLPLWALHGRTSQPDQSLKQDASYHSHVACDLRPQSRGRRSAPGSVPERWPA